MFFIKSWSRYFHHIKKIAWPDTHLLNLKKMDLWCALLTDYTNIRIGYNLNLERKKFSKAKSIYQYKWMRMYYNYRIIYYIIYCKYNKLLNNKIHLK